MIILDLEQGSPEWGAARLGIPTASQFSRLLTPTGKPSTSANGYMDELLAERLLGASLDQVTTDWMRRGRELEASAVRYYELQRDCDTKAIGFVLRDDGKCGCSPDRLVGEDGLLEIKCPGAKTHVTYLRGDVSAAHKPQTQGQLWICEREWCDVLSYHPEMPPALVRVDRDEAYIKALATVVAQFAARLDAESTKLTADQEASGLERGDQGGER